MTLALLGLAGEEDDDGNAAPKQDLDRRITGPTAMQIAAQSLSNAETVEQLAAIWKDIPRSVQGDPNVIKAKDDRKAALIRNADLDGDEIQY